MRECSLFSSMSFQMLKALLKRMSLFVKKEERRYSFIIAEAQALCSLVSWWLMDGEGEDLRVTETENADE